MHPWLLRHWHCTPRFHRLLLLWELSAVQGIQAHADWNKLEWMRPERPKRRSSFQKVAQPCWPWVFTKNYVGRLSSKNLKSIRISHPKSCVQHVFSIMKNDISNGPAVQPSLADSPGPLPRLGTSLQPPQSYGSVRLRQKSAIASSPLAWQKMLRRETVRDSALLYCIVIPWSTNDLWGSFSTCTTFKLKTSPLALP